MTSRTKAPPIQGEWECSDCGYYVRGTSKRAPNRCPDCSATSDAFDFWPDEEDWDDDDDYDYDDDYDDDD
jgi:hypothetical protein